MKIILHKNIKGQLLIKLWSGRLYILPNLEISDDKKFKHYVFAFLTIAIAVSIGKK